MTKKSLDEKYSYQIDEHNVVHLFRGEDDCQQYLTNPLLSAIFKIEELEAQIEQLQTINNEQKETLKKVRVALIQERAANIMNYGKGGVEMFNSLFEILKGVSN